MRICIDARPLQNGHRSRGIGVLVANLLRHLAPLLSGDEVALITQQGKPPAPFFTRERRVETFRLQRPNRFNWIADHLQLPGLVHRCGAELFLATDMNSYLVPGRGTRVVSLAYDLIPFLFPEVMASQSLVVRAGWRTNFAKLRRSDAIIAISRATRDDLVRLFGIDPGRVRVIYPGIDHRLFNPEHAADPGRRAEVLQRYGIEGPYFLYVGDSEWRKNLRRVLEALAGMDDIGLVLVGKSAPGDETLQRWIRELGLQGRVITPGFVPDEDLPPLYGGARAFLFPSLYEGFGFPVAEAMACGCPTITSNVSSMPEVAGGAALLVDPADTAAIGDAMIRMRDDAAARAGMRENGIVQAGRFSWERCAAETVALLRDVGGGI